VQIGAVEADNKIVVALAGEVPVREIARFEAAVSRQQGELAVLPDTIIEILERKGSG
jgi:hypothetical protein